MNEMIWFPRFFIVFRFGFDFFFVFVEIAPYFTPVILDVELSLANELKFKLLLLEVLLFLV